MKGVKTCPWIDTKADWRIFVKNLLADGDWHTANSLSIEIEKKVHIGRAVRRFAQWHKTRKNAETRCRVAMGRRCVALTLLSQFVNDGVIRRRGDKPGDGQEYQLINHKE